MSKQLLLVRVSVDRVGQRTTEHNRSSSPPDSRRLTEYNGVAKAKGWKISFPRNRVGKFRFEQITRDIRLLMATRFGAKSFGASESHQTESPAKWGSLDLTISIQTGKPALAPGLGHGAERA